MIKVTAGKFHSQECLIDYGMKKAETVIKKAKVAKKKVRAKEKRDFQKKDIDIRKSAAKSACHKYVNLRDKGDNCISCDRPLISGVNAGHFHESGNNPLIRYDEDNINSQCIHCNMYKGGNPDGYRPNLIKKIGIDRVKRLDSLKGGIIKRTCEDYQAIEDYYKAKIKELTK